MRFQQPHLCTQVGQAVLVDLVLGHAGEPLDAPGADGVDRLTAGRVLNSERLFDVLLATHARAIVHFLVTDGLPLIKAPGRWGGAEGACDFAKLLVHMVMVGGHMGVVVRGVYRL